MFSISQEYFESNLKPNYVPEAIMKETIADALKEVLSTSDLLNRFDRRHEKVSQDYKDDLKGLMAEPVVPRVFDLTEEQNIRDLKGSAYLKANVKADKLN